ncbi:alpha-L-fucosidase 2 [Parapedobacter luteus]|uniref:Alpha-L-fucosidase 2 n=1 Tax=Parapedobacter luteus TaxID=623280 RepID=A0A1T5FBM1_9SPHI|nr:glycoside hydrolase family 95 protein [Parapedobacter luteus]SKB93488.1 alpha-L-fucosidase 2 [Parapedobacter luteus]
MKKYGLALAGIITFTVLSAEEKPLQLWYDKPACRWEESLPLGNGRLGMMPDGGVSAEKIVLNEITLWSGSPQDANNYEAHKRVGDIQKLLLQGRNDEAEKLVNANFVCEGAGSGHGNGANVPFGCFQTLGELLIQYHHGKGEVQGYRRQLDITTAVAATMYQVADVGFQREYFTAFEGDVGIIRLTADQPQALDFSVTLAREERGTTTVIDNELRLSGVLNDGYGRQGMQYLARIRIQHEGGRLVREGNALRVVGADEATLYFSAATDFRDNSFASQSAALLATAMVQPYNTLKESHVAAFRQLFDRVSLTLAGGVAADIPTDERLKRFFENPASDNAFAALYFQYGRYLSISSTRPGLLPPNLQGLWAHQVQTPWNGDYHLNINAQMNHWPVEVSNLSELHGPFIDMIKAVAQEGANTAKAYYDAPGWVCYMMTNVWGYSAPGEQASWGASTASGWLCNHLWEHYLFTKDTAYLADVFPILKDAARFYHHTLIREPQHGWLVTAPSVSPENAFIMPNGNRASVVMGPTIDNQIVRELYGNVIAAAEVLGVDDVFVDTLRNNVSNLPPPVRIGRDGRVMEWLEEYNEPEPQHRHVSHLYGLYPAAFISPQTTPEWAEAARKTLLVRGDEGTGWSRAWKILFWARLQDGDHALEILRQLLRPAFGEETDYSGARAGTYPNLFCAHPPFQIDGNFGGTAGIAEMLLQSHAGFIHLLPALPPAWATGEVKGLKARGNYTVDITWKDGKVVDYRIHSPSGKPVDVMVNGRITSTGG